MGDLWTTFIGGTLTSVDLFFNQRVALLQPVIICTNEYESPIPKLYYRWSVSQHLVEMQWHQYKLLFLWYSHNSLHEMLCYYIAHIAFCMHIFFLFFAISLFQTLYKAALIIKYVRTCACLSWTTHLHFIYILFSPYNHVPACHEPLICILFAYYFSIQPYACLTCLSWTTHLHFICILLYTTMCLPVMNHSFAFYLHIIFSIQRCISFWCIQPHATFVYNPVDMFAPAEFDPAFLRNSAMHCAWSIRPIQSLIYV